MKAYYNEIPKELQIKESDIPEDKAEKGAKVIAKIIDDRIIEEMKGDKV
jgi:hypothetical protein